MTVVTFWYRRITEVAILLSSVIIGIWALSTYVITEAYLTPLVVSFEALILNAVVLVIALLTLAVQFRARTTWTTALTIAVLAPAILASIASTGDMTSSYIPLWVIVGLFGAVAGLWSFVPVCLSLAAYGGYLFLNQTLTAAEWVSFALVLIFPLLVGFLIWVRRFQAMDRSSQAVSRLAKQLSNESSKSEIVINAIADGVIVIDTDNIIQLINPAAERIVGWGKEDATNLDYRSVLKIIDNKDEIVNEQLDPVQQCLSTNQSVITEKFGIRTVSGKQLLASILVSPISETGSGVIVVFRDITAQRAEDRGQAEFISTASHEMRTPVAAIEGYLGLALNPQTATIDDKARMYLGKAHESAQHLGRLFQDLLDISKVEDGRLANKPSIVNVSEFVRCTVDDFSSQSNEKGIGLVYGQDTSSKSGVQTIDPIFYANVDPDHLKEIMSNLISNALKYSKEGTVKVEVVGDDTHIYISVKDSGIGIPAEDLPHLFQKFYRVDNTDTREIGGTGLGLYLSRRLAEAMDGHLNVVSTYGEGSTFTLDIPRVSKEAAAEAGIVTATPAPKPAVAPPAPAPTVIPVVTAPVIPPSTNPVAPAAAPAVAAAPVAPAPPAPQAPTSVTVPPRPVTQLVAAPTPPAATPTSETAPAPNTT